MANNDAKIGAKLVVDGEAEYKQSISEINKTLSVLSSEAKKTAAAYVDQKGSLEHLQAQTEDYNNQAEAQRKKVDVLREAYENSKKQLGENNSATQDWLIKLNNAEAALMKTEKAIDSNNAAIESQKNGTEKYRSAIDAVNSSLSVLESEARKVSSAYEDDKDSLEALKAQTENYNAQAEEQRKKVEILTEAYENSKNSVGENDKATQEWLVKLNDAEAALTKTEKAIEDNEKAIKIQSSAIDKVKSHLDDWKDKLNNLKETHPTATAAIEKTTNAAKKLASGGLKAVAGAAAGTVAGVSAIAAGATAAAKELYDAAYQAAQAGDAIDEASQRMGTSAETYQELSYAAKMSGVEVNTLETAAKKLKSTGSDMDLSEAINQIASIKDESERTEKAIELFGSKAAYEMGPMLSQGAEGIQALKDQAQELGIVMSNEAVSASASFNDSLDNLTGTVDAVKNNIAAEFLPGITDVMDGVTKLFSGSETAMIDSEELINNGLWGIVRNFEDALPQVMGVIENAVEMISWIAPDFLPFLVETMMESLDVVFEAAFDIIEMLADSLITEENITQLVSSAVGIVTKLVEFLGNNIDLLIDSAFTMIDALIDGLLDDNNAEKLVTAALDVVTAIVTGLIDNAPEMITGAFELIGALVDALLGYDWWQVAKDIFNGIKDGLKSLITGETDGSHAGGLDYVPYDGYRAVLHKGEKLLTASEAVVYNRQTAGDSSDIEELNRKVDTLMAQRNVPVNVNVIAKGSNGSVIRALKFETEREDDRSTAFKD